MGTRDEGGRGERSLPKAMRHKRILDVADEMPAASVEAIAEEVPSATPDLVEHVLEEYGDPAMSDADEQDVEDVEAADAEGPEDADDATPEGDDGSDADESETAGFEEWTPEADDGEGPSDPSEPTDKQREVLRAIYDRPQATQREIGDRLGVSAATVSNRVNAIDGFEWANREAIARDLFDPSPSEPQRETTDMTTDETEHSVSTEQLQDRLGAIERRIDDLVTGADADSALQDPELAHRVLHACFESDAVTEEDELRLLKTLLK